MKLATHRTPSTPRGGSAGRVTREGPSAEGTATIQTQVLLAPDATEGNFTQSVLGRVSGRQGGQWSRVSQRRQEERGGPHEGPPGLSGASPGTSRAVTHRPWAGAPEGVLPSEGKITSGVLSDYGSRIYF